MNRSHYLVLGLVLFALVCLPTQWTDLFRSEAAAALAPAWRLLASTAPVKFSQRGLDAPALQARINALEEWLTEEKRIQELSLQFSSLLQTAPSALKNDYQKRVERQKQMLRARFSAMPAPVIFRDPSSWSSILWVGLGEADNREIGRMAIARNSPVLLGNSLVGVVEYVGETQSRVRLITDSALSVAVRASRGGEQDWEVWQLAERLLERIRCREDLFASDQKQMQFMEALVGFQERLKVLSEEELLAKGEISGCSAPLWRSRGSRLKGSGFNYDYSDAEGSARDLLTGRPFGQHGGAAKPLLREGDLLVTSGLDGIFPPGIAVAIAKKIEPLREGSSSYSLEAVPTAGDLHDLHTLLILPPL